MNQLNNNTSVFKPLEHKQKDKANTVFLNLYAKLNKSKNPFDEVRSYTPPQTNNKPGEAFNDQN
jgi:hypothetical protein